MRKIISTALLGTAALSLALGACTKSGTKAADPESVKQLIKADEAKWNEEFKAKDTEKLSDHYADDAHFYATGIPPADGSTAIRQVYANASTDPAFNVVLTGEKIDASNSGDMAYTRGHFTEKWTDKKTGKVMTGNGYYLTIYKKQDDGSWKVEEDFAAADPDSVKPVPPEKPATRAKMTSM